MIHQFRRVGLRTLLCTALALAGLLAVAVGVGLAFPGVASPLALGALSGAQPRATSALPGLTTTALPPTGCGQTPPTPPGTTTQETLRVGALSRGYRLHVPLAYQANTSAPLVLSLHGRGSAAAAFEQLTGLSQLADQNGFVVVYPEGAVGADGVTGWNTNRQFDPDVDDALFVDHLLTQLQRALCINPRRIYATGFSNGGGMTAILACVFADRIAAFAPVAGDYYPPPEGCHPTQPAPLLEIHGTSDAVNPYNGSARLRYPAVDAWLGDWARRDGCRASPTSASLRPGVTTMTWSACHGGALVLHYRIAGGGHVWPANAASAGATHNDSLDASAAIWAFFQRFSLPAATSAQASA